MADKDNKRTKKNATSPNKERVKKEKVKKVDPLEPLKLEIAAELGLADKVQKTGWDSLSAREAGKIGGHMTKRLKAQQVNEFQPR